MRRIILFSSLDNLQVVSGEGLTDAPVNGLGNIIVGYDENTSDDKSGSHNLVVGYGHTYSSYGGIVAGQDNSITGAFSSVSGGANNNASGYQSSVSGGANNTASGYQSPSWGVITTPLRVFIRPSWGVTTPLLVMTFPSRGCQ